MTRALICHSAGPGVTVQDLGRSGTLALGLSRGGAADRQALYEGAALLGQPPDYAALELAGFGGVFEPTQDMRIALTGAPMVAQIDGRSVRWNASHLLSAHARLSLGAVTAGSYGYLHLGGGVASPLVLGARSTHLTAGLGQAIVAGTVLPVGIDPGDAVGMTLDVAPRFAGGELRVTASLQTDTFPRETLERFENTEFTRDPRANRMGVKMAMPGQGFHIPGGLQVLSEIIVPGDIQVTGDGTPFVLIAESQTTGGYPRIATVIPPDLARAAQAPVGAKIRFRFVSLEEAVDIHRRDQTDLRRAPGRVKPLLREPADLQNLAEFQLISGATSGVAPEEENR
ncbi:biotin-dependent carboxyltransferase family protein [Aestuariivita sp.]|jgi:allophanate hydrolase|uniref:5-oxoprolinase subunit C family protein n=1 Tax=Aestuariivita sp. TaxID=1872407 RepID=UPI0021739601|nr:biotin-dependent carboxyltransferase family protein [Aestuariivita sp.]MCE8005703.1 biotin-dependent carboxyltransferase [Aestuariivita sp.]